MPNKEIHEKISKIRTGDEYKELHKWVDEATESLGHNHRLERHFYTEEYKDFIKKKWGEKAVVEWLFHIALDNLETANKFAFDFYNKNFDEMIFSFKDKNLSRCQFIKTFEKSKKIFDIDLISGETKDIGRMREDVEKSKEEKEEERKEYKRNLMEHLHFDEVLAELFTGEEFGEEE